MFYFYTMAETNPNGANQHTPDPRQDTCWEFYVDSIRRGVPNAYQSAKSAGYEEHSATDITATGWFQGRLEKLKLKGMRSKAERNLDRMLDTEWEEKGEIKVDVMRVVADVSKTVAKSLGKEDWAERQEHSGVNGGSINISVTNYGDQPATSLPTESISAAIIESVG